ncbi:hypothetical protein ACVBEJ_14120 [Porticoccus sp. GXU_MW_L64]
MNILMKENSQFSGIREIDSLEIGNVVGGELPPPPPVPLLPQQSPFDFPFVVGVNNILSISDLHDYPRRNNIV